MSTLGSRLVLTGSLLFLTLGSGVWLNHLGKPYPSLVFTIHKLISLATIITTAVTINYLHQLVTVRPVIEVSAIVVTGLLFLCLLISGGLLSIGKTLPGLVLRIHQAAPLLAVISTVSTFYLLVSRR
jgi:hypothetical protein